MCCERVSVQLIQKEGETVVSMRAAALLCGCIWWWCNGAFVLQHFPSVPKDSLQLSPPTGRTWSVHLGEAFMLLWLQCHPRAVQRTFVLVSCTQSDPWRKHFFKDCTGTGRNVTAFPHNYQKFCICLMLPTHPINLFSPKLSQSTFLPRCL